MPTVNRIRIEEYCNFYQVEISFIQALNASGLISLEEEATQYFIDYDQIPAIEKFSRMHYEMAINMEGIEVIQDLLQKISVMQQEINLLKANIK